MPSFLTGFLSVPFNILLCNRASKSKIFRKILMPTAQFFHTTDVKIRMRILGLGKVRKVPELIPENRAIEVGVQIFNELVFFGLFAGVLLLEYYRQIAKEEVRQAEIELEKLELKKCIHSLESKLGEQFVQVLEMSRIITELQEDWEKAKKKHKKSVKDKVDETI